MDRLNLKPGAGQGATQSLFQAKTLFSSTNGVKADHVSSILVASRCYRRAWLYLLGDIRFIPCNRKVESCSAVLQFVRGPDGETAFPCQAPSLRWTSFVVNRGRRAQVPEFAEWQCGFEQCRNPAALNKTAVSAKRARAALGARMIVLEKIRRDDVISNVNIRPTDRIEGEQHDGQHDSHVAVVTSRGLPVRLDSSLVMSVVTPRDAGSVVARLLGAAQTNGKLQVTSAAVHPAKLTWRANRCSQEDQRVLPTFLSCT